MRRRRCAQAVAEALRGGASSRRPRTKVVMRWTSAGERTVKAWFAGTSVPRGDHLVELMRHSDEVLAAVLRLSGRAPDDG